MKVILSTLLLSITMVSACKKHTVRDTFGLRKSAPDEFMVLSRDELIVPREFSLIEPHAKNDLFVSDKAKNEAQKILFNTTNNVEQNVSAGESILLQKVGKKDAAIRNKINQEYAQEKNSTTQKLSSIWGFFVKDDDLLDAEAEKKRLKNSETFEH